MADDNIDNIDLDYEIADVIWPYTEPRSPVYQYASTSGNNF